MHTHYVGALGHMTPIELKRGASIATARPRGSFTTTGGVRIMQAARNAPRTWNVSHDFQDPAWARVLHYAAQGMIPECYLYDVAVARQNLLRSSECVGSGASVLVDGVPMGALSTGPGPRAYLLAGRTVNISCWTNAIPGAGVLSFTHAGETISIPAPDGEGSRYVYATYTPPIDGVLVTQVTGSVSGLRIHEGDPDRHFQSTLGTPCLIAVEDPAQTLQIVLTGRTEIDYQVTLLEVGEPTF